MNTAAASESLLSSVFGPSSSALYARASAGAVQEDAPLHARRSILIHAPRSVVWSVLTDFAGWTSWQKTVKSVTAPPRVAAGARFTWVNGNVKITSTLALVEPEARLAWTGSVAIAKAIHVFRLEDRGDATLVSVEETMDGFLLTWLYGQAQLEAEIERSLEDLRRACERA